MVHVLLGAFIGLNSESVFLVAVVAVLSHFLLDMIPHWDGHFDHGYFKKTFVANIDKRMILITTTDVLLAFLIAYLLYVEFSSGLVAFGALAAMLPDVIKLGYFTRLMRKRRYRKYLLFHSRIQKETGWKFGLLTQAITAVILLRLLFL